MISTLLALAAQSDGPSISIGIALTFGGMLAGGMLVFGAQRENVTQLNQAVKDLTGRVTELTVTVNKLSTDIEVMRTRDETRRQVTAEVTAKHSPHS